MPILDNTVDTLRELKDNGSLDFLYRKGLISPKPFQAINIYFKVESLSNIMNKHNAVITVSTDTHLSIRTIYRHLSLFK